MAMSCLPSPSKSPRTGTSPASPYLIAAHPDANPVDEGRMNHCPVLGR